MGASASAKAAKVSRAVVPAETSKASIVLQSESSTTTRRPPPVTSLPSIWATIVLGLLDRLWIEPRPPYARPPLREFVELPAQPASLCFLVASPDQDPLHGIVAIMDLDRNKSPVHLGREFLACFGLSGTALMAPQSARASSALLGRDFLSDRWRSSFQACSMV